MYLEPQLVLPPSAIKRSTWSIWVIGCQDWPFTQSVCFTRLGYLSLLSSTVLCITLVFMLFIALWLMTPSLIFQGDVFPWDLLKTVLCFAPQSCRQLEMLFLTCWWLRPSWLWRGCLYSSGMLFMPIFLTDNSKLRWRECETTLLNVAVLPVSPCQVFPEWVMFRYMYFLVRK